VKIGVRPRPFLEELVATLPTHGDFITSTYDTGADFYLGWGWPQCEQIARDNGGQHAKIICVDAHPFALRRGDRSGARILQLGNWGALAKYPDWRTKMAPTPLRATPSGPVLVLGQVYTAIQKANGYVDVWHTGGYEDWLKAEIRKPNHLYRPHPRVWALETPSDAQPALEDQLRGCSAVKSWNSTAAVHALMWGYPATAAEAHGWAHLPLDLLSGQYWTALQVRLGEAWGLYREWLASQLPQT
jgi:hypothetical protein